MTDNQRSCATEIQVLRCNSNSLFKLDLVNFHPPPYFAEHEFFPLLCFYTENKITANIQKIQITSVKQTNMLVSEVQCMYN